MIEIFEVREATPAGGGEISPAAADRATSLAASHSGEAAAVVEPPKQAAAPAEAGSDEINVEIFDWSLDAGSDGQTTFHRFGETGLVLTAEETREVYEFLANSARIWGGALL